MTTLHVLARLTLTIFGMVSLLRAQTGSSYQTLPPLGEVLPIERRGDQVVATASFAINWEKVVPSGAFLRTAYSRPPSAAEAPLRQPSAGLSEFKEYQRKTRLTDAQIFREKAFWRKLATENIWPEVALFRAAVESIDSHTLHLVYVDPSAAVQPDSDRIPYGGEDLPKGFCDELWVLPDGMFLVEQVQGLVIRAVEKSSLSEQAGLRAQDVVVRVGGSAPGRLAEWLPQYPSMKTEARYKGLSALSFQVLRDGQEVECRLPLPRSLQGGVLDLPVDTMVAPTPQPEKRRLPN